VEQGALVCREGVGESIHSESDGSVTAQEFVFGCWQYVNAIDELSDAPLWPGKNDTGEKAKWLRLRYRRIQRHMFLAERLRRFINCLGKDGTQKFKTLVERYNVLGNISSNRMASDLFAVGMDHQSLCHPSALKETSDELASIQKLRLAIRAILFLLACE
jgi:hypothetical protein